MIWCKSSPFDENESKSEDDRQDNIHHVGDLIRICGTTESWWTNIYIYIYIYIVFVRQKKRDGQSGQTYLERWYMSRFFKSILFKMLKRDRHSIWSILRHLLLGRRDICLNAEIKSVHIHRVILSFIRDQVSLLFKQWLMDVRNPMKRKNDSQSVHSNFIRKLIRKTFLSTRT